MARQIISHSILSIVCILIYLFLYLPIIVLIIASFNISHTPYEWHGFSFKWYSQLWHSVDAINALSNSLIVATSTTLLSITLGVLFVMYSTKNYLAKSVLIFYGTLAAPEVILAVGLLNFFVLWAVPLSLTTLIIGHTLLGLGYVIPIVRARFLELDSRLTEASLDLGATETQTFMQITLPLLRPAILAAALLVFIISLDDFIISFFCSGAATQTLPMYIYSMIRSGNSPIIYALSALLLLISSVFVLLFSLIQVKRKL